MRSATAIAIDEQTSCDWFFQQRAQIVSSLETTATNLQLGLAPCADGLASLDSIIEYITTLLDIPCKYLLSPCIEPTVREITQILDMVKTYLRESTVAQRNSRSSIEPAESDFILFFHVSKSIVIIHHITLSENNN